MARPSYPRAGEPRPAALPPEQRTVGQLVAESVRIYGDHFWDVLPLGLAFAGLDLTSLGHSVAVQTLILWAFGPLICAAFVRGCVIALGSSEGALRAWVVALIVFLPFPILVRLYALPGIVWFALFGLGVPAALVERLGVRAALARGLRLGRVDLVHAVGGIATLALVYGVSRFALLILLHTTGSQGQKVAGVLSDLVLSPLLFIGTALLYVDQAARWLEAPTAEPSASGR